MVSFEFFSKSRFGLEVTKLLDYLNFHVGSMKSMLNMKICCISLAINGSPFVSLEVSALTEWKCILFINIIYPVFLTVEKMLLIFECIYMWSNFKWLSKYFWNHHQSIYKYYDQPNPNEMTRTLIFFISSYVETECESMGIYSLSTGSLILEVAPLQTNFLVQFFWTLLGISEWHGQVDSSAKSCLF